MDTALMIFVAGTAASFVPMYWLATRLVSRGRTSLPSVARRDGDVAGRREFFDLLRREAAARAVAVLHDALVEARLAADHAPGSHSALSERTKQSLDETGRLIDSLFSNELRDLFRNGIDSLATASATTIGPATASIASAIAAFERSLDGGNERALVPARASGRVSRAVEPRRRGFNSAANVGAAA